MRKFFFMGHISKRAGMKSIEIPENTSIADAIDQVQKKLPWLTDEYIAEHLLLHGEVVIQLPRDKDKKLKNDLYITSIIEGG